MPRLLFLCPVLDVGGVEGQWRLLLPRLRSSFDVRLAALNGGGAAFDALASEGIPTFLADIPHRGVARGLRDTVRWAGANVDILVTLSPNALVAGRMISRFSGARHVVNEHSSLRLNARRRLLTRVFGRRVDTVIAVSSSQLGVIHDYGFPRARIAVVPNGVDPKVLAARRDRDESRRNLGVDGTTVIALMMANARPVKRLDLFEAGIAAARAAGCDVVGVVAGEGVHSARGVLPVQHTRNNLRLLGRREDIGDLLLAADVICLTSDREALPMSLLEAAAVGKPIISSDVGGVRDIVGEERGGLLFRPGDRHAFARALVRICSDLELRRQLGAWGKAHYRNRFDIDTVAEEFASELFRTLLANPRRRSPQHR